MMLGFCLRQATVVELHPPAWWEWEASNGLKGHHIIPSKSPTGKNSQIGVGFIAGCRVHQPRDSARWLMPAWNRKFIRLAVQHLQRKCATKSRLYFNRHVSPVVQPSHRSTSLEQSHYVTLHCAKLDLDITRVHKYCPYRCNTMQYSAEI